MGKVRTVLRGLLITLMIMGLSAVGVCAESMMEGSGTEADPYQVTNREQLESLIAGESDSNKKYYKLMNDIDLGGSEYPWTPSRVRSNIEFDGNGKTISGLYINGTSTSEYYGLFRSLLNSTIKNLTVEGSIHGTGDCAGGIAGGWVMNSCIIEDCVSNVVINGNFRAIGGIAGHASSGNPIIRRCYNTADITNTLSTGVDGTGGIFGDGTAAISNCYNTGNIRAAQGRTGGVGGKVESGSIANCYNYGEVLCDGTDENSCAARVVGRIAFSNVNTNAYLKVGNNQQGVGSFTDHEIDNETKNQGCSPYTKDEFKENSNFTVLGWDFTGIWEMSEILERPVLKTKKEILEPISYYVWDNTSKSLVEKTGDDALQSYQIVKDSNVSDSEIRWSTGWYVLKNDVTINDKQITVTGNVNLILEDGKTLTVNPGSRHGFDIGTSGSLTVYGQSIGDGAGAVVVTGSNPMLGGSGASLTINGGKVTSIGGQNYNVNVQTVTVNGGKLIAGPGTGTTSFANGMDVTTLVINGGEVVAKANQTTTLLRNNGVNGAVTVNGGSLTAAASKWGSQASLKPAGVSGTITLGEGMLANESDSEITDTNTGDPITGTAATKRFVRLGAPPYVPLSENTPITVNNGASALSSAPIVGDILTASCDASDIVYEWTVGGTSKGAAAADNTSYTVDKTDAGKKIAINVYQIKKADGSDYAEDARPVKSVETAAVEKKAGPEVPALADTGFTPDYSDESFDIGEGYEASSTGDTLTEINDLTAILDGSDAPKVYIRKAETDDTKAGAWLTVDLPARPAAPAGLTAEAATDKTSADGKIMNTTSDMEYKPKDSTGGWTKASDGATSVKAGTYLVRTGAKDTKPAGKTVEITVGSKGTDPEGGGDEPEETKYSVSGKLLAEDKPLKGATVILTKGGNTPVGETTTGDDGSYSFKDIPKGVYNLVATGKILSDSGEEELTKTIMVTVEKDTEVGDIVLNSVRVSSKVVVKDSSGEAVEAVVEGADEVAEDIAEEITGGGKAEVIVTVDKKEKAEADNAEAIEEQIKSDAQGSDAEQKSDFYDLTVEKSEEGKENVKLSETKSVLMFVFTYNTKGKKNFRAYRSHGGEVSRLQKLTELPKKDERKDGTFYVGDDAVIVFARFFSTYAVSYAEGTPSIKLKVGDEFIPDTDIKRDEDGNYLSPLPVPTLEGNTFDGYFTAEGTRITDGEGYFVDGDGNRLEKMSFRDDLTLEARFSPVSDGGGDSVSDNTVSANTVTETVTADGVAFTLTYVNKIIFDGRKHLAYASGITVSNTNRKAYDLPVTVSEKNGAAIDPKIIKVKSKKNKNAGTGTYKIKIKGKKYKALNKLLKSKEYKDKFKFEIGRLTLTAEKVFPALNKKGTKLKAVSIKDSDGNLHKLSKKDYTVENFDASTKVVGIKGRNNTDGSVTVTIKP